MDHDDLTGRVIGAAIEVHKELGPGLLESAYEACLAAELGARGIRFQRQVDPIHTAQVLTYLKLGTYRIALLINFNVKYLGEGSIRRLVRDYPDPVPRIQRVPR